MTDAITNEIISKIWSLPKAEAKKVIDVIKSFSASTNTITHSSKKTLEIWQKCVDCMISGLSVRKSAAICGICKVKV